jgi:RNA polymerase sigma-70 factor (ECF subfamily)
MSEPVSPTEEQADGSAGPAAHDREAGRGLPRVLDPAVLPDYTDVLFRAAWAMCGSRHDAEDLVQTTFLKVLRRPRMIRPGNERAYLLRALRNVHASSYRTQSRRAQTAPLPEDDQLPASEPSSISAGELMGAVATAPPLYRDAVIAIDVLGLSYREAARAFRTEEKTIATRLHRGRRHVVAELSDRPALPAARAGRSLCPDPPERRAN